MPVILNVDDIPYSLYGRSRVLKYAGYGVLEATSGVEALDKALSHRAALILLVAH